jgi:hypothetical protein
MVIAVIAETAASDRHLKGNRPPVVSTLSNVTTVAVNNTNTVIATGRVLLRNCLKYTKRSAVMLSRTCWRLALTFFFFMAIETRRRYFLFFFLSYA